MGGGMRQAGVIAAAGIVALETMVDRLAEDHRNARRLAEGLAELPGIAVEPAAVVTNIVVFGVDPEGAGCDADGLVAGLAQRGVACFAVGGGRVRWVTHREVSADDVEAALAACSDVVAGRT